MRTRILQMSKVWAVLGAIMGASLGMSGGGLIGAIAGLIVGTSELVTLGVIFALLGGRPQETILGAAGGLLGSLAVGMMGGPAPIVLVANFGLMVGAIVGATVRAYFRLLSLPLIVIRRLQRRHQAALVAAFAHNGRIAHRPIASVLHRHPPANHPAGPRSPLPHEHGVQ
jgi:hypothetical protein